jgi:hypothetical protein
MQEANESWLLAFLEDTELFPRLIDILADR